jgi:3-isopropylmalate dehydrogenase
MNATITVLPGDGIGPEVTAEGVKVLQAVAQTWGHTFEFREALLGGIAIDTAGSSLPPETVASCRSADAVLLGAVGGPKWDDPSATDRPERGLLGIRKALNLFANIRPVSVYPSVIGASPLRAELLEGVDLIVIRELTGGIYFGAKTREGTGSDEQASDLCVYTASEIERIVRVACELARGRRGKVTSVDKANVLETSRLWRSVTNRVVAAEYPDIQLDHVLVDAAAMHLLRRPADFDVIVTENMFGDILSDEASMLAGSMGLLPSASLGPAEASATGRRLGLYEPIHGSAPDIAGRGIANPLGTILSAALLLRYSLGLDEEAAAVEAAVSDVLAARQVTPDLAASGERSYSTSEVGDAVVAALVGTRQPISTN